MNERNVATDEVTAAMVANRKPHGDERIVGHGSFELRGPDGELKESGEFTNLITDRGDEYYAKLGASEAEDLATGMRLGTGGTAPSKAGAGSAIVSYVSGSNSRLDSAGSSDKGAGDGHRIQYVASWAAGVATEDGIEEVVITNEDPLTDVAGNAANTVSRALLAPVVNKGVDDTLTVTWNHDFLGS